MTGVDCLDTLRKIKLAIWATRFAYIAFFSWQVVAFFVLGINDGLPGLLFLLTGFLLFYLEKQLEKANPKYADTFSCTIWRFLLVPWFLVM
ncbi:hypothetical protein FD41_GL000869 [Lentilactobacillus farraginis DSM 18382 = JCM 14108]|uniref:Uncharacterized protein n=1 Tax=Lentilactobacillus farraginis DSM 18382 = JCM 14108 TaxID=1423743 RepID=A0A0R1VG39_9LACO|nr:hypothetical protein FD41_GL000869 [Lentilactobacillus farraginis DSM 18382 = JCM 14108]